MSLKAEFLILQNFVIGDITRILEKRKTSTHPNKEDTLCQEQIKYLREEEFNSKNLIKKYYLKIKIKIVWTILWFQIFLYRPKKDVKISWKERHTVNFLSPNRFSTLDFNNDVMIMENNSYDKDPGNYTKENTDKRQNSIYIWQMEIAKVILDHQYIQLKNTCRTIFINNV